METINHEPIYADFGNADEDGAIRLITNGTLADLDKMHISLEEGQKVWLSDGDVEVRAEVKRRGNIWVAVPYEKYKNTNQEVS